MNLGNICDILQKVGHSIKVSTVFISNKTNEEDEMKKLVKNNVYWIGKMDWERCQLKPFFIPLITVQVRTHT